MNQSLQGDWYYTREGEPVGPISFEELKAKAADSGLNPPLEMVWTEGMDAWKPVDEIKELRGLNGNPVANAAASATKDQWYYILNDEHVGPVSLAELRNKISDPSIFPPLKLVWTDGMAGWKAVYEVPELCEPGSGNEAKSDLGSRHSAVSGDSASAGERRMDPERRAHDKLSGGDSRTANTPEERAAAEARARAEAKARAEEESRLRIAAETRAAARAIAEEEARRKAVAEARVVASPNDGGASVAKPVAEKKSKEEAADPCAKGCQ